MFTVAVVEDDETAVAKLRACLDQYAATHAGVQFDVTVFNEPTSFLDPYKTVWDIVFMDIEMPNMDGGQAARGGASSVLPYPQSQKPNTHPSYGYFHTIQS